MVRRQCRLLTGTWPKRQRSLDSKHPFRLFIINRSAQMLSSGRSVVVQICLRANLRLGSLPSWRRLGRSTAAPLIRLIFGYSASLWSRHTVRVKRYAVLPTGVESMSLENSFWYRVRAKKPRSSTLRSMWISKPQTAWSYETSYRNEDHAALAPFTE